MKNYRVDLHTHTCLSPCGDARMIPENILAAAAEKGIDVIGITDHNSAENVPAVMRAAADFDITVIGGMELTTEEEVHVLCLFDGEGLGDFQDFAYSRLHGSNDPEAFGQQYVVDFEGGVLDLNPRLLIGAADISIQEAVEAVHEREGVAIAAHIDREVFSILGQLGFIPPDLDLDGVELSPFAGSSGFDTSELKNTPVTFSDAHYLEEVGRSWTDMTMAAPGLDEIRKALRGEDGRTVWKTSLCM